LKAEGRKQTPESRGRKAKDRIVQIPARSPLGERVARAPMQFIGTRAG